MVINFNKGGLKMSHNKLKTVFLLLVFMLFFSGFTDKKPVADLSDGRDGKIFFLSTNATFKELIDKKDGKEKIKIEGFLSIPKNINKKVPAVVLLHGITGVKEDIPKEHLNEMADTLNEMDVAAFIIDSQSSRDVKTPQEILKRVTLSMRVVDAYAALHLLSTHPKIDKDKIGVLGLSRGGNVAMLAQSKKIKKCFFEEDGLQFAAVVLCYPSCLLQLKNIDLVDSPILILLGEKDNITPTPWTLKYAEKIKATGANVEIKVYKNAHHAFDFKALAGQEFQWFDDFSGCQDRYSLLEDDGMWFNPFLNKRFDDGYKLANVFKDCRKSGQGILGGPKEARKKSIEEYKSFFRRVFK